MSNKHLSGANDSQAFKDINENPVIVDFTGCKYIGEVHNVLKESLGFPDYYGNNLDALYDLLRGFRSYPIVIEIYGLNKLPIEFVPYLQKMKEVFADVQKESPNIAFHIKS